jgi:hypothetical protein
MGSFIGMSQKQLWESLKKGGEEEEESFLSVHRMEEKEDARAAGGFAAGYPGSSWCREGEPFEITSSPSLKVFDPHVDRRGRW